MTDNTQRQQMTVSYLCENLLYVILGKSLPKVEPLGDQTLRLDQAAYAMICYDVVSVCNSTDT